MRTMILTAVLLVPCVANAAEVDKMELKCLDPQEYNDNVVVKFYVDGQKVDFTVHDQVGTHPLKRKTMSQNGVLIFDNQTRAKLKFGSKLRILVLEYDVSQHETLADITINRPASTTSKSVTKTGSHFLTKWKYELKYTASP